MVATKQITVEEFETMPLEGRWELIDGELVEMSPSAEESSNISATVVILVGQHVRANRLGRIYTAEGGFVLFPDLAVEVLSPSDRMADALNKVSMYLEAGVRIVWLVDPASRTVTVFRPDAAPRSLDETDALDGGDVLPGLSIPIANIFG